MSDEPLPAIGRRRLLGGLTALGLGAALSGCSALPAPRTRERATCVARGDLVRRRELADVPLSYEVDGRAHAFWFDAAFADRLELWLTDLRRTGLRPVRLWTYGAWTDGGRTCDSWHDAGRAFDLARIELREGRFLSCRYDRWRTGSEAAVRRSQREYWTVAASLHRRFAYVVAYPYDEQHHNHIHLDNGRSGGGEPTFDQRSPTQVQAVQAISTHVFDRPVEVTGRWSRATEQAVADVLADGSGPRSLTAEGGWSRYLAAATAVIAG